MLEFLIKFACIDNDLVEVYSWHTNISKSIIIAPGIENSAIITSPLPDIIATWKEDIYNTNYAYEAAVEHGFSGTEEEWLADIGDNTELRKRVSNIESALNWISTM